MRVLLLILIAAIAYFFGSLNGAIISARFFFRKDVRDYGSGNAGLTNYYRTFGVIGIALVIAIDIVKSVLAILIGGWLLGIVGEMMVGRLFAGFCLIMGHVYPAYYHFKGGKGALCGIVMTFMIDWRVGLCCLASWLVIVIFTRYVSLGSMAAALLCPVFMLIFEFVPLHCVLALLCALLIVAEHAENILRLIGGTERRLDLSASRPRRNDDEDEMY